MFFLAENHVHMQLKKVPDYHGSSFNAETLGNDSIKPSADRAKQYEHAANIWNKVSTLFNLDYSKFPLYSCAEDQ